MTVCVESTETGAKDTWEDWLCEFAKVMPQICASVCSSENRSCSFWDIKICKPLNWSLNPTLLLFAESMYFTGESVPWHILMENGHKNKRPESSSLYRETEKMHVLPSETSNKTC